MGLVGEMVDDCVGWGILSGYIWVRWWMVVWGEELCGYFDLEEVGDKCLILINSE